MICQRCEKECERTGARQKYCPACAYKKRLESNSKYIEKNKEELNRKNRERYHNMKSPKKIQIDQKFLVRGNSDVYARTGVSLMMI